MDKELEKIGYCEGFTDRPAVPDLGKVFVRPQSASERSLRFNDALKVLDFYRTIIGFHDDNQHVIEANRIITAYLEMDNNEESK